MKRGQFFQTFLFLICLSLVCPALARQNQQRSDREKKQRVEDAGDYYRKWLEEDVVYIINREEKRVFEKLTTAEEKQNFIEQFWIRRDPNPSTSENEFKTEHYRRIAFANERYASGYPGWLTDRGRIYITFGEPDEIQSHTLGESYDRPLYEGGGSTQTYPYQLWRYRHIEGLGDNVELEFVDRTLSGEYRLAILPEEKDALTNVGITGPTLLEQLKLSSRVDRGTPQQNLGFAREKDAPFLRYEAYADVLSPPKIEYTDLQQIVAVDTRYDDLPFSTRNDYIQLDEDRVLALVTLQVDHNHLVYKTEGGSSTARLAVYGIVTSLTKRVIYEFDDDLESRRDPGSTSPALKKSVYQKAIPVDRKMRYKLSLVVKDLNSEKIGVAQEVLIPPAYDAERLTGSSLILSEAIQSVGKDSLAEMFVIGDLKVRPNPSGVFSRQNPLGLYFQIYNMAIDPSLDAPALTVGYKILKDQQVLFEQVDPEGKSIQFFSGARVVLVRQFNLKKLEPGQYRMQVTVKDRITGQELLVEEPFRVVDPS